MMVGPLGNLISVRSPQAMPASQSRDSETLTLATGQVVQYRAPRSARTWQWSLPWATDDDVDDLLALEQGAFGPAPWRWYDPVAAATNMLPDVVAAAGIGEAPWRWFADRESLVSQGGSITLEDGRKLPQSISPNGTVQFPMRRNVDGVTAVDPLPVIPGRAYTLTLTLENGTGVLSLVWVDAAGELLSRVDTARDDGRLVASGTAPLTAAGCYGELSVGTPGQALSLRNGSYVSTPDNAALDIVGDLDVRVRAALDDWKSGYVQILLSKYLSTGDQRSYELHVREDGRVAFTWTELGTGDTTNSFHRAYSTAPLPAEPNDDFHVRATMDVSNTAGVWEVNFFYSRGVTPVWVQLGTAVLGTLPTTIFSSSAPVTVGVAGNLSSPASGDFYSASVRSGIAGTVVANPDWTLAGSWVDGDTAPTARADTAGRTWTLAGAAAIHPRVSPTESSRAGGIQLTEGSAAVKWRAGMGMPHVSIAGLDSLKYSRITADEKYRDIELTLIETA
jgi:hypothetical protein